MNTIIFLTVRPDKNIIQIYDILCKYYNIFILVDDNNYINENKNINIIQIKEDICKKNGFTYSGGSSNGFWSNNEKDWINKIHAGKKVKNPSAWDKALYYCCILNNTFEYIWFIEEDVFLSDLSILKRLDNQYKNTDLLCKEKWINTDGNIFNNNGWSHWMYAIDKFDLPWYKSLISICRMSHKLIELIKNYVEKNKKLFYDEILFITLAAKNNLSIENPPEFCGIDHPDQM